MNKPIIRVDIRCELDVVTVHQRARLIANIIGFSLLDQTRISTAVSEIAHNALIFGRGGTAEFSISGSAPAQWLTIVVSDQGPGIANLGAVLRDSISGKGNFNAEVDINLGSSLGIGLGAVRRLSSQFDIFSAPGQGTAVFSRCWQPTQQLPPPALAMEVGAVCLPVMGEKACGDAWAMKIKRDTALFLLADGLGHGFLDHPECTAARKGSGPAMPGLIAGVLGVGAKARP